MELKRKEKKKTLLVTSLVISIRVRSHKENVASSVDKQNKFGVVRVKDGRSSLHIFISFAFLVRQLARTIFLFFFFFSPWFSHPSYSAMYARKI